MERAIAIIPAKGFSNRLANKNKRIFLGKPMVCWAIDAAKKSKWIDEIYVSTEDYEIKLIALGREVNVIDRPLELCEDHIGKQEVVEHAFSVIENVPEIVCLLQANSPQVEPAKIDEAIERVANSSGFVKECISMHRNSLITDGAIRVFRSDCINNTGLGMYLSTVLTDYIDVHNLTDLSDAEEMFY